MEKKLQINLQERAITLVALVITIVILIILAVVTVNGIFGESGLIAQANKGKEDTKIADTKEQLEIILSSAFVEKHKNPEYNENEFLDDYIHGINSDVKVEEDEITLNEHTFELDRSVPQLGEYVGEAGNLPPRIKKVNVVDRQMNEITIEVISVRAENAKYIYSYKAEGEEEYISTEQLEDTTYTFQNLNNPENYDIKVELVIDGKIVDTEIIQASTKYEVYIWEKWSINKSSEYKEVQVSPSEKIVVSSLYDKSIYVGYKIVDNKYVLTNTVDLGTYSEHGGVSQWKEWARQQLGRYCTLIGNRLFKGIYAVATGMAGSDGQPKFEITGNIYEIQEVVTITKGDELLGEVTSSNENEYPKDGNSGDYWYVYKDSIIQ